MRSFSPIDPVGRLIPKPKWARASSDWKNREEPSDFQIAPAATPSGEFCRSAVEID